jgi:hypothetical protein
MYKSHKKYKWGRVGLGRADLSDGLERKRKKESAKASAKALEELKRNPLRGTQIILRKKEAKNGQKPQHKAKKIGTFGELLIEALNKHARRL